MIVENAAHYQLRKFKSRLMLIFLSLLGLIIFIPLLLILFYLIQNGIASFSWNFFTQLPKPVGESGGGMAHAILGSFYLVGISGLIAIPWGLSVAIFLAEARDGALKSTVRFITNLLNGTPSIVYGIFIYFILVKPFKTFSALSGSVALAVVILPIVIRTIEEILRLIPHTVRHAGLSLGLTRWQVVMWILVYAHRRQLMTGILLALSRSFGETAPLLFTAFGSMYFSHSLLEPMASLPVEIYNYAISPYPEWHNLAWTGSLVLILMVFCLNLMAKLLVNWDMVKTKVHVFKKKMLKA